PNDPSDIAWGIISATEDPKKRIELGQNGRKRALELFSWETAAKSTIEQYSELIKTKKSKDSTA
ncbi:glycosyltransferase family 1 protein, partial [Candidatus Bathyarchaeota archaeon]|nr:glycosyltransferase family 1 protein [Candidatus Bathyarchaeota archaeon]